MKILFESSLHVMNAIFLLIFLRVFPVALVMKLRTAFVFTRTAQGSAHKSENFFKRYVSSSNHICKSDEPFKNVNINSASHYIDGSLYFQIGLSSLFLLIVGPSKDLSPAYLDTISRENAFTVLNIAVEHAIKWSDKFCHFISILYHFITF